MAPMSLHAPRSRTLFRRLKASSGQVVRCFSMSRRLCEIRDIRLLPPRLQPRYQETRHHDLLGLKWPMPPRNILLTLKENTTEVKESFIEFAKHLQTYPDVSIILELPVAQRIHESLPFPVYALLGDDQGLPSVTLHDKVDLISTLGGDGTILRASALFAACPTVPPILSFSMGTLGFLGEWKFKDYKRAFREVYMSGATIGADRSNLHEQEARVAAEVNATDPALLKTSPAGWSSIRGKFMGGGRSSRVLLRNRLKIGIYEPGAGQSQSSSEQLREHTAVYAMNEVIIHRGAEPHLAIVEVSVGGRFLTEAVADGMIVSTPTGSTAYNLSSGGSIVHPLVASLLLTPICPRSLSFRPLVLPANTPITLRLSEKNRGRAVDVSIDGVRRPQGLEVGAELRVCGEDVRSGDGEWSGGVPSIVRGMADTDPGSEDSWVGGLNGLLKFNYPFGEE